MPSFSGNVLLAYRDRYPNVHVSAHDVVHEPVVDMVERGVVERGVVELGIGFEPDSQARVHFTPLFTDRFVAVVPASSPLVAQGSLDWTNLLSYGFIALQRPSSVRRLLEQRLSDSGIGLPVALECHQLATVGQTVAAGLGVSAVPALCKPQMSALGARCLALKGPVIKRDVGLISRLDQELSTAAAAMASETVAMLRRGI